MKSIQASDAVNDGRQAPANERNKYQKLKTKTHGFGLSRLRKQLDSESPTDIEQHIRDNANWQFAYNCLHTETGKRVLCALLRSDGGVGLLNLLHFDHNNNNLDDIYRYLELFVLLLENEVESDALFNNIVKSPSLRKQIQQLVDSHYHREKFFRLYIQSRAFHELFRVQHFDGHKIDFVVTNLTLADAPWAILDLWPSGVASFLSWRKIDVNMYVFTSLFLDYAGDMYYQHQDILTEHHIKSLQKIPDYDLSDNDKRKDPFERQSCSKKHLALLRAYHFSVKASLHGFVSIADDKDPKQLSKGIPLEGQTIFKEHRFKFKLGKLTKFIMPYYVHLRQQAQSIDNEQTRQDYLDTLFTTLGPEALLMLYDENNSLQQKYFPASTLEADICRAATLYSPLSANVRYTLYKYILSNTDNDNIAKLDKQVMQTVISLDNEEIIFKLKQQLSYGRNYKARQRVENLLQAIKDISVLVARDKKPQHGYFELTPHYINHDLNAETRLILIKALLRGEVQIVYLDDEMKVIKSKAVKPKHLTASLEAKAKLAHQHCLRAIRAYEFAVHIMTHSVYWRTAEMEYYYGLIVSRLNGQLSALLTLPPVDDLRLAKDAKQTMTPLNMDEATQRLFSQYYLSRQHDISDPVVKKHIRSILMDINPAPNNVDNQTTSVSIPALDLASTVSSRAFAG